MDDEMLAIAFADTEIFWLIDPNQVDESKLLEEAQVQRLDEEPYTGRAARSAFVPDVSLDRLIRLRIRKNLANRIPPRKVLCAHDLAQDPGLCLERICAHAPIAVAPSQERE